MALVWCKLLMHLESLRLIKLLLPFEEVGSKIRIQMAYLLIVNVDRIAVLLWHDQLSF